MVGATLALVPLRVQAQEVPGSTQEPAAVPPPAQLPPPAVLDPKPQLPEVDPTIDPESLLERPEAVVWLKDGGRTSGLLIERTEAHVVLGAGEVRTTFAADQIARVEVLPTILERYLSQRALIEDTNLEQRVDLARWVYAKGRIDLALRELESILASEPNYAPAKELRELAKLQQRLTREAEAKRQRDGGGGRAPKSPPPKIAPDKPNRPDPVPLLTPEQVNLIKVYEVDLRDPPRLAVAQSTITDLLRAYADNPLIPLTQEGRDALYRKSAAEILDLMFQLRARDFYGRVSVRDQPRAMQNFRDDVHRTWLMNRCATAGCHGGADAGKLRFATQAPNSEATFFTNFLIIDRFKTRDGRRLINTDDPARSPLLHYGLRRELSLAPHPAVPVRDGKGDRWQAMFQSADDPSFQQGVDWILSLSRPRADYPIEYPPKPPSPPAALVPPAPSAKPATRPNTDPR